MKVTEALIKKHFEKEHGELAGVEFLRYTVQFCNNRPEGLNENQTPEHLMQEAMIHLEYDTED